MQKRKQKRCFWQQIPDRKTAYCHLFDANCAICPFDSHNRFRGVGNGYATMLPEKYFLSREHLWLAPSTEQFLLAGIDSFLAGSLYHTRSIVQPKAGAKIVAGTVCAWVIDLAGVVPLRAPVTGTVLRSNSALLEHPTLLTEKPYGAGWLFEIEPDAGWHNGLMDQKQGEVFIERSYNLLKDRAVEITHHADLFRAAADGGLLDIEKLIEIDKENYLQLLIATLESCRKMI